MLKKANRIRNNKDFDRIFKTGQSFYGRNLGLKVAPNKEKINRVAILISAKVSRKAVERNKLRRQLRAIISRELAKLKDNYDLLIIVFPPLLEKSFPDKEELIRKALISLNLYK